MEIHQGEGWRLRIDPDRQPFCVLIGGADWAAELTLEELRLIQQAVLTLLDQLAAIAPMLMSEEDLTLEHERSGLWMQLDGSSQHWALRFVLQSQPDRLPPARGLEGGWDAAASGAVAALLQGLVLPPVITVPA